MKSLILAAAALIACASPVLAHDDNVEWIGEDDSHIVERRVTVETFVRPAYRAPDRRIYAAHPADVYDDVPYGEYARPRSRYVAAPYSYGDEDDRECTVKRRWRHGRLIEKIRCD